MDIKNSIVGFTGTRAGMTGLQYKVVRNVLRLIKPRETHSGDCVGADHMFWCAVRELGYRVRTVGHPCNISHLRAHCRYDEELPEAMPLDRNFNIVDASDVLIATPRTQQEERRSGTWATIRYARKCGKPVLIVYPNGMCEVTERKHEADFRYVFDNLSKLKFTDNKERND